ncbi:MAG: S-layer homology domain-containing protein [Clostridiales bacterium]|jgi:hypothetical protein|nr:S-layer homology domain-containing protein [Clostridiales bacterium]
MKPHAANCETTRRRTAGGAPARRRAGAYALFVALLCFVAPARGAIAGAPGPGGAPAQASPAQASLAPAGATQSAPTFSDVSESDWFYAHLTELAGRGLIVGNADGTFAPSRQLQADEFIAMALRLMGHGLPGADGYWAEGYISKAAELGLVRRGEFARYDEPISRENIARIIARCLEAEGEAFGDYGGMGALFSDIALASDGEPILKAISKGIVAGYGDGTFRPRASATRAEAVAMLMRMAEPAYRLEEHEGTFYNAIADLNESGNMKKEKAEEFIMKAIGSLRAGISGNGNVVLSGRIPRLPDGQFFNFRANIVDTRFYTIGFAATASVVEGEILPLEGDFEIETAARAKDTYAIELTYTIPTGEPPMQLSGSTAAYYITHYPGDPGKDKFYRNDIKSIKNYSMDITEGVWGW